MTESATERAAAGWRTSVVLPYQDLHSATAGLGAELRHLVAVGADAGAPDWATFAVDGPRRSTDGRGRVWFQYGATLLRAAPGGQAGALSARGRRRLAG